MRGPVGGELRVKGPPRGGPGVVGGRAGEGRRERERGSGVLCRPRARDSAAGRYGDRRMAAMASLARLAKGWAVVLTQTLHAAMPALKVSSTRKWFPSAPVLMEK